MFGRRFHLFRILGFNVGIDTSWFLLAILITWTLAVGVFPTLAPELTARVYWTMGVLGALGLFASVIFHELAHSLVARRRGMEMRGITLFIFGGVAEMTDEPPDAKTEALMAIAGPIASFIAAGAFYGVGVAGALALAWPQSVVAVLSYLGLINAMLAIFNLVPAFPLDGGRILRALLWGAKGSFRQATRIASSFGSGFGVLLMVLGVFALVFLGNPIAGIWWFVLGLFVRGAAQMSYRQALLREALQGEPVRRFMKENPITVPRSLSVRELVEDYVYRHQFQMFPVVEDGRLVGCVSTKEIRELPREEWPRQSVAAIIRQCDPMNTVNADRDALEALGKMSRGGNSRLLVVEGDRLLGVLTLKDLLGFFEQKIALEDLPEG
jgi:Zn-dependent protease/predicted transcriptional regulator